MRHLDEYKIFERKISDFFGDLRIDSICRKYGIKKYFINKDRSIDVEGDVEIRYRGMVKLPLKFNKVTGSFYCHSNELTTLKGSPKYVGGGFFCSHNKLTSLEGGPEYVGGDFFCSNNQLTSLEGCPKRVAYFDCSRNKITSLEGCPDHVDKYFACDDNPIFSIVRFFINTDGKNNLIELFNYYDIVCKVLMSSMID